MIYRTYFNLIAPVNDFDAASKYLLNDDMTKYMEYDNRIKDFYHKIDKIEWILRNEQSGYIELRTNSELTEKELLQVSDWVSGQNSDGIGEGFEQQDFACYEDPEYYGYGEDDDDIEDNFIMASFDWQTNDYIFEFVSD